MIMNIQELNKNYYLNYNMEKECKDCWHNYHCPMPQEGYDFNPDTCPYNPDNEKKSNN